MEIINIITSKIISETWIFQILLTLLGAIIANIACNYAVGRVSNSSAQKIWSRSIAEALYPPLIITIWLTVIKVATNIALPQFGKNPISWSNVMVKIVIILAISWFLYRLVGLAASTITRFRESKGSEVDHTTIGAVSKLARLVVMILAILIILQNLGISVSGVLAAGGVGGLVIGFAAKDLLANFFGGLTIYLDKPFRVGDWIRCNEKTIEGVVEYIGWRHTRIRAFNKNPIYIPNSSFTTIVVENPSRMSHRRIREVIGVRYCDIAKMEIITSDVRSMLDNHEEVDKNQPSMAYFVSFGPSSVDFMVNALILNTEWHHFSKVKHEILLAISDIIEGHGAEIAFPTRTIHVEGDS